MSPRAGFLLQEEIVPRLKTSIPQTVHCVGSEDAQELVQDSIAMAAKLLTNAENAGKRVTAGNIAHFTSMHMRSGRRSTGTQSVDVHGTACQLNGNTRLTSMDEPAALDMEGGEIFCFHDVISDNHEDPSITAARKMDWDEFIAGLSDRELALIECMLAGRALQSAADKLKIHLSTLQSSKHTLARKIIEFMGADILATINVSPLWKINLDTERELLACRHERRPA